MNNLDIDIPIFLGLIRSWNWPVNGMQVLICLLYFTEDPTVHVMVTTGEASGMKISLINGQLYVYAEYMSWFTS